MRKNIIFLIISLSISLFLSYMILEAADEKESWTYGGVTYHLPVPRDKVNIPANLPEVYIVKEKDTLWDLSGAFLSNTFFWPLIWEANPDLKNPHRIYPGDKLKFPGQKVAKKEEEPKKVAVAETKVETPPVVKEKPKTEVVQEKPPVEDEYYTSDRINYLYASCGFISNDKSGNDVVSHGEIISAPFEHGTITYKSKVMIDVPVCEEGMVFQIFRLGNKIKHPVTKKVLGRMVSVLGYLKVICKGSPYTEGIIETAYDEIRIGDKVVLYKEPPLMVKKEPLWEKCYNSKGLMKGTIVLATNNYHIFTDNDIVYLDLGSEQGIKAGEYVSAVICTGTKNVKVYKQIAQLLVLRTQNKTSSAVVMKSINELDVGNIIELI
jgi:hypothetical protein